MTLDRIEYRLFDSILAHAEDDELREYYRDGWLFIAELLDGESKPLELCSLETQAAV